MLISPIIAGGGGDSSKELDPVYEAISHVADSMDIKKVGNNYEAGAMHALYPFFDFHNSSIAKKYGIDFSITKHVFLLLLVAFITVTSIIFLVQRYIASHTKVPGKPMNFIEMIVVYIRENVLKNFIGEKYYREWAPLIYTLFFFILVGNFLGLIPIFDFLGFINYFGSKLVSIDYHNTFLYPLTHGGNTVTANINLNFALATITFFAFTIAGMKKYGPIGHWKNFAPPGLAWPLYFIVVPIEILGMLLRPLTLTLRLAGNMMGGHLALIIFTGLVMQIAQSYNSVLMGLVGASLFSVPLSICIIFLEILVGFLQAYVFALLTAVFIGMAVNVHH
ncbi:MAG: F0F1 ATP synthase subunit A [Candidatus Marinimicrobia bacterium]|jgi:F-type H+-transporting ATPase subunit a|nr:F0F1 ATP synthase subunit A [Candidatus Neomarinimicrobiota bacterium]